ncbi:MAG: hypothetical protein V1722_04415 [Candidatus Micrarchaeota archaeon]
MASKLVVSADRAINWYLGNYIESPNNALRDEEKYFEELENGSVISSKLGCALQEVETLRVELRGKMMTHKELLELMKQRGIHLKYYRYKKYENNCITCKALGVNR